MLRGFYIAAMALSLIFIVVCTAFIDEVSSHRYESYSDYSYGDSSQHYENTDHGEDITITAGISTMFLFLIMETIFIISLVRLKTKTMKVFSIIGISLTGIMILWDVMMISNPGNLSFDEVGPAWIFYLLVMLGFSIVGTIHAFRKKV